MYFSGNQLCFYSQQLNFPRAQLCSHSRQLHFDKRRKQRHFFPGVARY